MGWAAFIISRLKMGENVTFAPHGHSMTPKIKSGQVVHVAPIGQDDGLDVGDIVLCKVHGAEYLHLISAIRGGQYQISNNHGHVNGWIARKNIYGIMKKSPGD